jgi:adenine-specific DNA methylase
LFPDVFGTPQTPKDEEATSHKHRHQSSQERANAFYQRVLTNSFKEAKRVATDPKLISVMFAHQSTEAWAALLAALFDAGLCPVATWPIATELPNAALGLGTASLETSVTVVCQPRVVGAAQSFKNIKKEIALVVQESVHRFWNYGFRGADLIVACYGPTVGVFGKYGRVEKADGGVIEVSELLDLARRAARDAIAGEFRGDSLSTLYYVWANLYATSQQGWDDARLVVQIGGDTENAMEVARRHELFVVDGAKCRLALLRDRTSRRHMGQEEGSPLIDQLHRAMRLWKNEDRSGLVDYLRDHNLADHVPFWKLAQALFEVLPRAEEDWKLVSALLGERETLRVETRKSGRTTPPEERGQFE